MNCVVIKDLSKQFGQHLAVDNLSLTIETGEIFGLLGPNGAGKSTTIHMICGLLQKSKGSMTILGHEQTGQKKDDIRKNIGLVPQDIAVYDELTAYENVHFFAGLYGFRGADLKDKVLKALAFVGLTEHMNDKPASFSGGMKRRLNIACAIAHEPQLVIMDEPTVGIDPQSRNYILESIKKLNQQGTTVIYTSHYMEEIEEICTTIAIIDHGKVIAEGSKEALKSMVTDVHKIRIEVGQEQEIELSDLALIRGVKHVERTGDFIEITSAIEVTNLNFILIYLMEQTIEIKSVDAQKINLETVFLTLTGRTLRD
ncbi:ABC transporter ATP-binding protein [Carnobacterium divergens]|uniref:ABC transporter ATP-binding protein n=1 Tax=Carnobacterium divergens TaxID=2748 RepID=UPI00289212D2|nr:ABC transporter ATP-binding protein [Carnobacterium divergens]MDT2012409.1 ABC transporter ATP-binding protein [Carnobacterium divergens]